MILGGRIVPTINYLDPFILIDPARVSCRVNGGRKSKHAYPCFVAPRMGAAKHDLRQRTKSTKQSTVRHLQLSRHCMVALS